MERALAQRRREIEWELMQLETDVWKDLNKEQQALVDAEQQKMDLLTKAVIKVRSVYHQEVFDFVNRLNSPRPSPRDETTGTASKPQQTERMDIEGEICEEELVALREEVRVLEEAAHMLDQHKRLIDEPLEGDDFKQLQEALLAEEVSSVELQRQIRELEEAVQEAQPAPRPRVEDEMPVGFNWIEDPWDQEPGEAAAASAMVKKAVCQPSSAAPDGTHNSQKGASAARPTPLDISHRTPLKTLVPSRHFGSAPQAPNRLSETPPVRPQSTPRGLARAPAIAPTPRPTPVPTLSAPTTAPTPMHRTHEAVEEEPPSWTSQGQAETSSQAQGRFVPKKALLFKRQRGGP